MNFPKTNFLLSPNTLELPKRMSDKKKVRGSRKDLSHKLSTNSVRRLGDSVSTLLETTDLSKLNNLTTTKSLGGIDICLSASICLVQPGFQPMSDPSPFLVNGTFLIEQDPFLFLIVRNSLPTPGGHRLSNLLSKQ